MVWPTASWSKKGCDQPPWGKLPLVSSCGPPGACTTPVKADELTDYNSHGLDFSTMSTAREPELDRSRRISKRLSSPRAARDKTHRSRAPSSHLASSLAIVSTGGSDPDPLQRVIQGAQRRAASRGQVKLKFGWVRLTALPFGSAMCAARCPHGMLVGGPCTLPPRAVTRSSTLSTSWTAMLRRTRP